MLSIFIFKYLMILGPMRNQYLSISSENPSQDLFRISTSEDFRQEKIRKKDMHLLVQDELLN